MQNILPCDYAITLFNKLLLDVLGVSLFSLYLLLFLFWNQIGYKNDFAAKAS